MIHKITVVLQSDPDDFNRLCLDLESKGYKALEDDEDEGKITLIITRKVYWKSQSSGAPRLTHKGLAATGFGHALELLDQIGTLAYERTGHDDW